MTPRERGRALWHNVWLLPDGSYRIGFRHRSRYGADCAASARWLRDGWKLLYRIRVRYYLEPKT